MKLDSTDQRMLEIAIAEAELGRDEGGLPIGSTLAQEHREVSRGRNRRLQEGSPILHAEMDCIDRAGRRESEFYRGCTLYTTLSPCPMCSGTILLYGIKRVVVGAGSGIDWPEKLLSEHGVEVVHASLKSCEDLIAQARCDCPELLAEDGGAFFAER